MAQPSKYVEKSRTNATTFKNALDAIQVTINEYNELGGQSFVAQYLDEEGHDITTADFVTFVSNMQTILTYISTNDLDAALNKMLYQ